METDHKVRTLYIGDPQVKTKLDLFNNSIGSLPGWAFCFYRKFHTISLVSNKISVIDKYAFSGLEKVKLVRLQQNNLVSSIFSELPACLLFMKENQLEEVPALTHKSHEFMRIYLDHNMVSSM